MNNFSFLIKLEFIFILFAYFLGQGGSGGGGRYGDRGGYGDRSGGGYK